MLIHFLWVFHTSKFVLIKDCSCSCLLRDACFLVISSSFFFPSVGASGFTFTFTHPHSLTFSLPQSCTYTCIHIYMCFGKHKWTCRIHTAQYLLLYLWRQVVPFKKDIFVRKFPDFFFSMGNFLSAQRYTHPHKHSTSSYSFSKRERARQSLSLFAKPSNANWNKCEELCYLYKQTLYNILCT